MDDTTTATSSTSMKLAIILSEDASDGNPVRKGGDVLTGHLEVQTDCLATYDIMVTLNGQ